MKALPSVPKDRILRVYEGKDNVQKFLALGILPNATPHTVLDIKMEAIQAGARRDSFPFCAEGCSEILSEFLASPKGLLSFVRLCPSCERAMHIYFV